MEFRRVLFRSVVKQACAAHRDYGWPWPDNKYCDDYYATEYECSADLPIAMQVSPVTGASWHATGSTNQIVTRRVDSCGDLAGDGMCLPDGGAEVCVEGPETRI